MSPRVYACTEYRSIFSSVAPAFAYAFEMYEADTVVGGAPQASDADASSEDTNGTGGNIVILLCKEVIKLIYRKFKKCLNGKFLI